MANLYKDIILPFKNTKNIKMQCYYNFIKNRKRYNHILYLTYKILEFPESNINLESLMSEYLNNFIKPNILPLQSHNVSWSKIVLKSIPSTVTFQYNLDILAQGTQEDSSNPSQSFCFELQKTSSINNKSILNLYGVPSTIKEVSSSLILETERSLLYPLVLENCGVVIQLNGLKSSYENGFISVTARGFKAKPKTKKVVSKRKPKIKRRATSKIKK